MLLVRPTLGHPVVWWAASAFFLQCALTSLLVGTNGGSFGDGWGQLDRCWLDAAHWALRGTQTSRRAGGQTEWTHASWSLRIMIPFYSICTPARTKSHLSLVISMDVISIYVSRRRVASGQSWLWFIHGAYPTLKRPRAGQEERPLVTIERLWNSVASKSESSSLALIAIMSGNSVSSTRGALDNGRVKSITNQVAPQAGLFHSHISGRQTGGRL